MKKTIKYKVVERRICNKIAPVKTLNFLIILDHTVFFHGNLKMDFSPLYIRISKKMYLNKNVDLKILRIIGGLRISKFLIVFEL